MIQIPDSNKRFSVPNTSDLFGNIQYTKNMNFDETGYIRLSPRAVSLFSEQDVSNIRLPLAFGRKSLFAGGSIDYAVTQAGQKGYWLSILESSIALNPDTGIGAPDLTADSHGAWYQNLWTVTDDTKVYTKADVSDVATYSSKLTLTSATGKTHFVEPFRNRNTVCISNGNTVEQLDSSYSASTTLTLPSDYEVISLKYSKSNMGVLANPSADTTSGQNQDAYFFIWSGASTSATQGYPIGTDKAIAMCTYKGTWVVLTKNGEGLRFNGGGFDEKPLFVLPQYAKDIILENPITRKHLGDVMLVDGDIILFNFSGLNQFYGKNYEDYLDSAPGGILCFDPSVGFYHRYSPSISPATLLKVSSANINMTTDIMTITALASPPSIEDTIPSTGNPVKYISDRTNQIGGLKTGTIYYCIRHTATDFSLAETKEDAFAGNKIHFTSTGASNNYFLALEVYDYGQSIATTAGAIAHTGKRTDLVDGLVFGAELNARNSTGDYNHIMATVPTFENRGYFVTAKIPASGAEDNMLGVFLRYKPLSTGDKIIVKMKTKDIAGLPVSTPQERIANRNQCAWTSSTTFTTTADLSDAITAFDNDEELECEIIGGAGAGVMAKITGLTESNGTYTVTLEDEIDGAASGRYCDVKIDNWMQLDTIDHTEPKNWKWVPAGESSDWFKFKVEHRGVDTAIEQATFINKVSIPAVA